MIKRLFPCFLVFLMVVILACVPALAEDEELQAAAELGIAPAEELFQADEPIATNEFYQSLVKSVTLNMTPSQSTLSRADTLSREPITRGDAATLIYSVVLENYFGLDTSQGVYNYDCFEYAKTFDTYKNRSGDAMPCAEFVQFNKGEISMDLWSVGYCALQYDPYSLKTILDVNEEGFLRIQDSLTKGEAWRAAYRLYRSYRTAHKLTLESVEPLALSTQQLDLAGKMPDAAYNSLPAWKGTALDNKTFASGAHHTGEMYTQEDFEILHDLGFNYTRLFITHELLYDLSNGVAIWDKELYNLDDAISFAIDNGVHITICLYDFPGFAGASMDDAGFYDEKMLTDICDAYALLAKRYQQVPNSVLSFNLFNEPWKLSAKQEKVYVKAVHAVSDAIWKYGSNRLIFVDGLAGSQLPVKSLAKEHYAQAFHMYAPDQFTYSGWVGGTTWYAGQQWPLPYATGAIEKGKSMTLKGSFGAGTELELLLVGNSKKGNIELIAGKEIVATLSLEAEETQGGKTAVLGTLPGDVTEIKIRWTGSDFVQIQSVAVIYPQEDAKGTPRYSSPWAQQSIHELVHRKMTVIYCDYGFMEGKQAPSTLTIQEDGTYTNVAQAKLTYNQAYLKSLLDPWIEFKKNSGLGVMVQEWGTLNCTAKQASLNYIHDWIDLLAQYNIPWNLWADSWQYLDTGRLDVVYEDYRGHQLDRDMVNTLMQRN